MPSIFYASYVAMWALLLVNSVLLLLVYRHFGLASLGTAAGVERDGLKIGEKALTVKGITMQGEKTRWLPEAGRWSLLAFVAPNCGPCEKILPSLLQLSSVKKDLEVVVISLGGQMQATRFVTRFRIPQSAVCLAEDGPVHEDYRVRVTPFAFMIGPDGLIRAKGLCSSIDKLQHILSENGFEVAEKDLQPPLQVLLSESPAL